MKRILNIIVPLLILATPACKNQERAIKPLPLWEQWAQTQTVLMDSTATLTQLQDAMEPLAASLNEAATDINGLDKRLSAQQIAYAAVFLLDEQLDRLAAAGQSISQSTRDQLGSPLVDAASQWQYSVEDGIPCVWTDQYYLSNKNAADPVDGYFHLMVLMTAPENPEPEVHFFFPVSAESRPALLFRKYKDPDTKEEDIEGQDLVPLSEWYEANALGEGFPLYATAKEDIIRKMMENDVMYLLFTSSATPNGDPGEGEMAQVLLRYFQEKYKASLRK